jgi:YbbR domain-containing protein
MGFRIRQLVRAGTFVRLLASIVLATIIWGFVVWETNPEVTREFSNIAVTASNVPADMLIVGGLPSVDLTVKGPQDIVQGLVPSDVTASVDFSDVQRPGTEEYEIEVSAPSGVRTAEATPASIEVELSLIVTRSFPINIQETGERPASVTSVDVSTDLASVQGPLNLIEQIDSIVLPVDLEERRESFSEEVDLIARAQDGSTVDGVEISPAAVEVAVTFELTSLDVPVVVICACIVENRIEDIELVTAAAIPSTIRLSGPSSALTVISEIRTRPVDISSLEESGWKLDVELDTRDLPSSVSLSDLTVDVWVPISPSRVELPDVPIEIFGLSDDFTAELSHENVVVVVTGDDKTLIGPEALQLTAIVNLSNYDEVGTYDVAVGIVVPLGVSFEQVTPETVRVVISTASSTTNRLQDVDPDEFDSLR